MVQFEDVLASLDRPCISMAMLHGQGVLPVKAGHPVPPSLHPSRVRCTICLQVQFISSVFAARYCK